MRGAMTRLVLAAVVITACSGDSSGPNGNPNGPQVGTVSGRVIDVDSSSGGVAGASVQLTGAGATQTVTTQGDGTFTLANAAAGAWTIQLTPPSSRQLATGETGTRTATVTAGGTANVEAFRVTRPRGTVTGTVQLGGTAISAGTVSATRTGFTARTATPAGGAFTLADVPIGQWTVTFTPGSAHMLASGETGTRSASVTAGGTTTLSAFQVADRPPSTVVEIHLTASSTFSPATVTIAPGTTVRWINDVSMDHTITPQNTGQAGVWSRAQLSAAGAVFEHTFTAAGQTYRYRCEPHSSDFTSGMVGMITVTGG